MSKGKKIKVPRRTTLFFKYFRVTVAIMALTMIAMGFVFLMFLVNYWTATSASSLKSNAESIASTAEAMFSSGRMKESPAEANIILCNSLNMVSSSIGADVFMTNKDGDVILCKDLLNSNMQVQGEGKCPIHMGYTVPEKIIDSTTDEGFRGIDRRNETDPSLYMIVGTPIDYDGSVIGYIFATTPVNQTLRSYSIEMIKLFAGAATVSTVIAIILIYIFSYGLTNPLQEMSRITKLYARGDFSKTIKVRGNDELSDLAKSLNAMGESLSVLENSRRSFVANVSHELKTPMTSIGGFIDGILDGTIPQSEEKHYLDIVSKEIKRLSTLVVTMLTLSKIEAGEEKLNPTETELRQLLFDALLSFEKPIEDTNINIEGFEEMPSVRILADEKMLFQVVYNLFDNAVKFTNIGGTIKIDLIELPDRALIAISNTGEGISKEEIVRVFERFYKVDKSRSEHVKGVGLGLNLAKNIVELHGGEIHVESEPGKLTTFSFWIPKKLGEQT